jgi:hypothetical protein
MAPARRRPGQQTKAVRIPGPNPQSEAPLLNPFADDAGILRVTNAAQNVPAAHKPWSFSVCADDRIELRANFGAFVPRRNGDQIPRLNIEHPLCREPVISAGMALFNLRLAIRVTGHDVAAWILPDPANDPSLLASVEIVTGRIRRPSVAVQELYDTIPQRHALPSSFEGPPVPENILAEMMLAAFEKHGFLRILTQPQAKQWLEETASAERELAGPAAFPDQLRNWTGESTWELGQPAPALRPVPDGERPATGSAAEGAPGTARAVGRKFLAPWAARRRSAHPQLLVLSTRGDRPLDWLYAGQAVQRAMLIGTRYGASVAFLTQPLQLADMSASRAGARAGREWQWHWPFSEAPQLALRAGYTGPGCDGAAERRGGRFPGVYDLRGGQRRKITPPGPVPPEPKAA